MVQWLCNSTGMPPEKILEVLKVIQTFEPPGVGARDLRECLLLQLQRSSQQNTLEYRIVDEFMEALGKRTAQPARASPPVTKSGSPSEKR